MAIPDDDRLKERRSDEYIDRNVVRREGNPVGMVGLLVVALILAAFVGWYMVSPSTDSGGVTRTNPPVSSSPTTGTTSNPTTSPKQP